MASSRFRVGIRRPRMAVTVIGLATVVVVTACGSNVAGRAIPAAAIAPNGGSSSTDPSSADPSARGSSSESPRSAPRGPAGPVPPGLETVYSQQLSWESCSGYAQTETDQATYNSGDFECANLSVPVSYEDSTQPGTVTIGVLKAPATGPDVQGSVIFNPGGPGASGMSLVAQLGVGGVAANLREHFDLIGFDPRGTGASKPAVNCLTDADRDANRAANLQLDTEQGAKGWDDQQENFVAGCIERTGADQGIDAATFLGSVGTATVVKDMDVLRGVLGDEKLTYVGYSYGTRIGTEYAEQFTGNVRAMVLDGAVDPNLDAAESVLAQAAGFQQAFVAYASNCASSPDCPLGTDPAQATQKFQQLVRPLLKSPAKVADGRVLTFDDATTGAIQAMYADFLWPTLTTALTALADGSGTELMALADQYEGRDSSGKYSNLMDAFTAIRCMDDERPSEQVSLQLEGEYYRRAPFLDPGTKALPTADTCEFWPAKPTSQPHIPNVPNLAKVMVVSTTGDPATPYQAGVDLAKYLNGSLVSVEGTRHTAYLGAQIPCVDDVVDAYLIDLAVPTSETKC